MLKHLFIPHPSKKERKAEMLLTFSQWMLFWSVPFVRFNPHLCLLHLSALFPPLNEREREREGGSVFKKIHLLIPFAGHSRWNHIASSSFFLSSVNSFKILPSLWKSRKALSSFCFFLSSSPQHWSCLVTPISHSRRLKRWIQRPIIAAAGEINYFLAPVF